MSVESWVTTNILDKALSVVFDMYTMGDVRYLLCGEPVRTALTRALHAVHADLEATHPQLTLDVFTPEFFRQDDVQAELARLLTRHPDEAPDPRRLAELARARYRPGREPPLEALLPAAERFLQRFRAAAEAEPELRPFFDSRALEQLHEIAAFLRTAYPRVPYRREIAPLLDFYVEPFVGREEAIQAVTAFTAEGEGGYLLIEAGPGMGKTALVAQLVHRYEVGSWRPGGDAASDTPLLYVFLRQEGGHHTPQHFLAVLNSQLLDALGFPGGVPTDTETLARQFTALWAEAADRARPGRPLTLLVDGLDEILPDAQGRTVADFLPADLPPHVHVVVTSRPQPKAFDWVPGHHPLKSARIYRLARFGPAEVRELLAQAGDTVPRDDAFLQRLVELTRGEPLFLRFLCEDVAAWGAEAQARLEALPPLEGVEDYFQKQLKALEARAEGEVAREVLGLLCAARGPMSADELAEALEVPKKRVRDALKPLRRFLLGEERVELMHLEFRRVVAEEWFTRRELEGYEERLLRYCARWQEHESDYALAHYANHLFDAERYEELYDLIDREWMERKHRRTGSHRGFATDVELAFQAARQQGLAGLPRLVQCALALATLGSLATAVPPEALEVLARLGRVEQALDRVRLVWDPTYRAEGLQRIADILAAENRYEEAVAVLHEALAAARQIDEPYDRGAALVQAARALAQAGQAVSAMTVTRQIDVPQRRVWALAEVAQALAQIGQIDSAFTAAREIEELSKKAEALAQVARTLVQVGRTDTAQAAAQEALAVARQAEHPYDSASALTDAAQALAQTGQIDLAFTAAREIEAPNSRARALAKMTQAFAQAGWADQAQAAAQEALTAARQVSEPREKVWALVEVAQILTRSGQTELAQSTAQEAIAAAHQIEKSWEKDQALICVIQALAKIAQALIQAGQTDQAQEALTAAHQIEQLWEAGRALIWVAQALAQTNQIEQALTVACAIESPDDKAQALAEIARVMAQAGQTELAQTAAHQALEAARQIEVGELREKAWVLAEVAQALAQIGQIEPVLVAARQVKFRWAKAGALAGVAWVLVETGHAETALTTAREALMVGLDEDDDNKAEALAGMAQALAQVGYTEQGLAVARQIEYLDERAWVLAQIAQSLAETGQIELAQAVIHEALATARQIETEESWKKTCALAEVAQTLAQVGYTEQARAVAREIEEPDNRDRVLAGVAHGLALATRTEQALAVAREIEDPWQRVEALAGVAWALAQAGQPEPARSAARQALTTARQIEDSQQKAKILTDVARALAQTGYPEQALTVVREIKDSWWKATVLTDVVHTLAQIGYAEQALAAAREIEEPGRRAQALVRVTQALTQVGQAEQARTATQEALAAAYQALEAAGQNESSWLRIGDLARVAHALAESDQTQQALVIVQEAFEEVRHADRDDVFHCLRDFAPVLATLDPQVLTETWERVQKVEGWWVS